MKLGYLYGGKLKGSVDLGVDPYSGLPSTLNAPGGITPRTVGTVFFVDGFNGDNDNDGLSKDTPFLTITYALTQVTAGADDVIYVIDCYSTEPAYPIVVNKSRVHIIGLSALGLGGKYVAILPLLDNPTFSVPYAGSGCEISGLSIGGGATSPCILLDGAPMDVYLHDLWFGNQYHLGANAPQDGVRNDLVHNVSNAIIENCRFFGSPGPGRGGITRYGVYSIAGGADSFKNSAVVGNRFHCMSYAIRFTFATDFLVEHNYIMCPSDDAVGRGIYLNACLGGIIANNKAGDNASADMTNSPYYDDNDGNNAWLCNQNGKTYVVAAVAL